MEFNEHSVVELILMTMFLTEVFVYNPLRIDRYPKVVEFLVGRVK